MSQENPFTKYALEEVRKGKKTVEVLERTIKLLCSKGRELDQTEQKMLEGIKEAIDILEP